MSVTPVIAISTDGVTYGSPGVPNLAVALGASVYFQDQTSGATPISRNWSVVAVPGPVASVPSFSSASAGTTSLTLPSTDGVYLVSMSRVDGGITTTAFAVVGVPNSAGFLLPSPGLNGSLLAGLGSQAIAASYAGSALASDNILLDAFLRYLYSRATGISGFSSTVVPSSVVTTSNATQQTIGSVVFPASTGGFVDLEWVAYITTGAHAGQRFIVRRNFYIVNTSGTVTDASTTGAGEQYNVLVDQTSGALSTSNFAIVYSGSTMTLKVTGLSSDTVYWTCRCRTDFTQE